MSLWKRILNFFSPVQEEKPKVSTVRPCIRRLGEVQDTWHDIKDSIPLCKEVTKMQQYFDMKYRISDWFFTAMIAATDGKDSEVNSILDLIESEAKRFQEMFGTKEPANVPG